MNDIQWLLTGLGALLAGAINALAGGGTLISFPILTAVGIPAVIANATNTVALCPGYLAAAWTQRRDLRGQAQRLRWYLPAGLAGGLAGGFLLLQTGEQAFRALVPYLILFASALLAAQSLIRHRLLGRYSHGDGTRRLEMAGVVPAFIAAIYGGYFGAGVSVVVLAVFGLVLDDTIIRLNALKQGVAFAINLAAALFFAGSGTVDWRVAGVMAVGALVGGALGGRLIDRLRPDRLRWMIVAIGMTVAGIYFSR